MPKNKLSNFATIESKINRCMNLKFFLFLLLPLSLLSQTPSKKIRVLFIGNSYTYVNNLPLLISNLGLATGDSMFYDSSAPGGYTFLNHTNDVTTLSKISAGNWDYVVLQAQSQEPSFSPTQVASQTLPSAIKLDTLIKHYNPCATTVFYETWGRKNGDVGNCQFYPPVCTYVGMQNRLKASYKLFADSCRALMAPAGEAFRLSITNQPTLNLYQADDSHPSLEGSFLTAAVFYEMLFKKSVITNTYNPGVAVASHSFLLQTAHSTVSDSMMVWNIGKYIPVSTFTLSTQVNVCQFQSQQQPYTHKWYFGDGNTSSLANPSHTYAASGNYTVSHVVTHRCKKDSTSSIVTISIPLISFINSFENSEKLSLYPNPCGNELNLPHFELDKKQFYLEAFNVLGETFTLEVNNNKINVAHLNPGVYFLLITHSNIKSALRFVKE